MSGRPLTQCPSFYTVLLSLTSVTWFCFLCSVYKCKMQEMESKDKFKQNTQTDNEINRPSSSAAGVCVCFSLYCGTEVATINYWWKCFSPLLPIYAGSRPPKLQCFQYRKGRFCSTTQAAYFFMRNIEDRNSHDSTPEFLINVPSGNSVKDRWCGPALKSKSPSWMRGQI